MNLIFLIHLFLFIIYILGSIFAPIDYLPLYFIIYVFIIVDWYDKDGMCWLSKLEGRYYDSKINTYDNFLWTPYGNFGKTFMYKILGINVNNTDQDYIIQSVNKVNLGTFMLVTIPFLIAQFRLLITFFMSDGKLIS